MNRVDLLGYLGTDVPHRTTQSGNAVTNFRMATTEKFRNSRGDKVERTEWHNIVAFGKLAETCIEYLNKGRQVLVTGRLQTRQWDDKEGNKRYTTEIVAQSVTFLGGKREDRAPADDGQDPGPQTSGDQPELDNDDVAF